MLYVLVTRCIPRGPDAGRTDWWQFTSLSDQPGNPGLNQAANPGPGGDWVWRVHAF